MQKTRRKNTSSKANSEPKKTAVQPTKANEGEQREGRRTHWSKKNKKKKKHQKKTEPRRPQYSQQRRPRKTHSNHTKKDTLRERKEASLQRSIENINKILTNQIPESNIKFLWQTTRAWRLALSHAKESSMSLISRDWTVTRTASSTERDKLRQSRRSGWTPRSTGQSVKRSW